MAATDAVPDQRILPAVSVLEIGGQSPVDRGRAAVNPVVEELVAAKATHPMLIGTGGGTRARHAYSLAAELGLPPACCRTSARPSRAGTPRCWGSSWPATASPCSTPVRSAPARCTLVTPVARSVIRRLPWLDVVSIGGTAIMDRGRDAVLPVVDEPREALPRHRMLITTGAGIRARHRGGAERPHDRRAARRDGVSYVAHETAARRLAAHLTASRAVVSNGYPPYGRQKLPPAVGTIPVHRADAGTILLADAHGAADLVYVMDVEEVNTGSGAVGRIGAAELLDTKPENLSIDALVLSLMANAEHVREIRIVNGLTPGALTRALAGEDADPRLTRPLSRAPVAGSRAPSRLPRAVPAPARSRGPAGAGNARGMRTGAESGAAHELSCAPSGVPRTSGLARDAERCAVRRAGGGDRRKCDVRVVVGAVVVRSRRSRRRPAAPSPLAPRPVASRRRIAPRRLSPPNRAAAPRAGAP